MVYTVGVSGLIKGCRRGNGATVVAKAMAKTQAKVPD